MFAFRKGKVPSIKKILIRPLHFSAQLLVHSGKMRDFWHKMRDFWHRPALLCFYFTASFDSLLKDHFFLLKSGRMKITSLFCAILLIAPDVLQVASPGPCQRSPDI